MTFPLMSAAPSRSGPRRFPHYSYRYRTNPVIKLKCVPTLLRWGSQSSLDDAQSQRRELVQTLLEE